MCIQDVTGVHQALLSSVVARDQDSAQRPSCNMVCLPTPAGHWSRDCTLPPSEWLRKPVAPAQPAARQAATVSTPTQAAPAYRSGRAGGLSPPQTGRGSSVQGTQQRLRDCYKCGKPGVQSPPADAANLHVTCSGGRGAGRMLAWLCRALGKGLHCASRPAAPAQQLPGQQ
jgi:hypothetical protein